MQHSGADAARRTAQEPPDEQPTRLPYLPALDGLRALAVAAVVAYHAGVSARGGFLGVESFFVLSGYLITALLVAEWERHGRIDLPRFWRRRARRLLPALLLTLLGTLLLTLALVPAEAGRLPADLLAAIAYLMNWRLILSGQSYFDPLARPPLLQHLWSLAIEEQFYLLWPLAILLGLRLMGVRGLLPVLLLGAGASALLMAHLYQPGADPSRVYYGTDTRAAALLLGSALALVWRPWMTPARPTRHTGLALDLLGGLALVTLLIAYLRLFETHPWLYRGGFALVALATALVIAAVTHPRAWMLSALLSLPLLRWIGLRSYGIYLWHWPIFMVSRPYLDVPFGGWLWLALRVALVLLVADLSFRLVELPIRRQGFRAAAGHAWRRLRTSLLPHRLWRSGTAQPALGVLPGEPPLPTPAPIHAASRPCPAIDRKPRPTRIQRTTGERRRHQRRRAA